MAVFAGAMVLGAHARAAEYPDVQGWTIFEAAESCGMSMEYEGEGDTQVILSVEQNGAVFMLVGNYNWSVVEDQKLEIITSLNQSQWLGSAIGTKFDDGRRGFAMKFGSGFSKDLAAGSGIRFYRGDVLIDSLTLSGSAAALETVKRCNSNLKRRLDAEAREKARLAHIPKDPFAEEQNGGP